MINMQEKGNEQKMSNNNTHKKITVNLVQKM